MRNSLRVLLTVFIMVLMACKHDNNNALLQEPFKNSNNIEDRISIVQNLSQEVYNVAFLGNALAYDSILIDSLIKNGHDYRFIPSIDYKELNSKKQEIIINDYSYKLLVISALSDASHLSNAAKMGSVVLYTGSEKNDYFNASASKKIRFGNGGLIASYKPHEVLNMMQVEPQFTHPEGLSVEWKQYRFGRIDIFMVKNTGKLKQQFEASFGTLAGAPELWDPENGQMYAVYNYQQVKGNVRFNLSINPNQTLLYVFGTNTDRDNMETYRL